MNKQDKGECNVENNNTTNDATETKTKKADKKDKEGIKPLRMIKLSLTIRGNAPYVGNKFSGEAREIMRAKQASGAQSKKGGPREPKDFEKCRREATHFFPDGTCGLPATAFRQAMVSACRLVGFKMVLAKLAVFVEADGFDADDKSPLIRFTKGEPTHFEVPTINETGVADIRARPLWEPGWEAVVRFEYDGDLFSANDIRNLMARVGRQVGIGAGRPDSKQSCGQGWGTFDIVDDSAD